MKWSVRNIKLSMISSGIPNTKEKEEFMIPVHTWLSDIPYNCSTAEDV